MKKRLTVNKVIDILLACVIITALILLIFTAIMIWIFVKYGSEPTTLIGCFFTAFSFEIIACALIKIFKLKFNKGENNEC